MGKPRYKQLNLSRITKLKSKDMAYILGLIATDGCIHKHKSNSETVNLTFQEKDKFLLKKVKRVFGIDNRLLRRSQKTKKGIRHYWSLTLTQSGIVEAFNKWYITPAKSHTLRFPNHMPKKLLRHYIRGCWDGDGSIIFNYNDRVQTYKQSVKLVSGSRQFLEGMQEYLTKKKIKTTIRIEKRKKPRKDLYTLAVAANSREKFYHFLYKTTRIFLVRKKQKYTALIKHRSSYKFDYTHRSEEIRKMFTKTYLRKMYKKRARSHSVQVLCKKHRVAKSTVYNYLNEFELL